MAAMCRPFDRVIVAVLLVAGSAGAGLSLETVGGLWLGVETSPPLPSFSSVLTIWSLSSCCFLASSFTCSASFFKSSALALLFAAGWFSLSLKSLICFSRVGDFLALRRLHFGEVLDSAVDFFNQLLCRRVLRARQRSREREDKKPKQNLSHAPKINPCAPPSSTTPVSHNAGSPARSTPRPAPPESSRRRRSPWI